MAYTPTPFVVGATLDAQTMRDNDDALRQYLHSGVAAADLDPSLWIDTRHVQPPKLLVKRDLQSGVTGMAGGRMYRPMERFTFATYTATGMGRQTDRDQWEEIPDTAMSLPLAGNATIIYHWHVTALVGPDTSDTGGSIPSRLRRIYIAPYFLRFDEELDESKVDKTALVEIRQNSGGYRPFVTTSPVDYRGGAAEPYHWSGYGQRSGVMVQSFTGQVNKPNIAHVGLAHWSLVQRSMLLNWSVSVEVYY